MTAGRHINTQSQHWGTPNVYVDAVKQVFSGKIDLDPCSNKYSIVHAKVEFMLPEYDGLKEKWDYPTIYVNPPYGFDKKRGSTIKHWLAKCLQAYQNYQAEVIALVPVATNTGHWKNSVFGFARAVCFLYDTRLRFLVNGNKNNKGAPMACAMVYWGNNFNKFYDVFINYGAVVDLSHLQKEKAIGPARNAPILPLFQNETLNLKESIYERSNRL